MFASYEYVPEVREEEERVVANDPFLHGRRPTRTKVYLGRKSGQERCFWIPGQVLITADISIDEAETVPFFPKLPAGMTVEQALSIALAKSPTYAVTVYEKATREGRFEILGLLPGVVKRLVTAGSYTQKLFEETREGPLSCLRILKGHARQESYRQDYGDVRERGVAIGMVAALGVLIA